MKKSAYIWFPLVMVLLLGAFFFAPRLLQKPYRFQGSLIEPAVPAADFELLDQHGQPFRLQEQRGKVVLLFFGYTFCPDVCPTTLADYRRIFAEFGEQAEDLRFVFITVDPRRDTPEKLAGHLQNFSPDFIGLTAEEAVLQQVWQDYGVVRDLNDEDSSFYLVDHTSRIYVIDAAGYLRLTFPYGLSPEAMASDLANLLDENRK